jgi:hypothetical protein
MMTPVLRTRCTKAMNLKAHTQRALKRGDGNSNSKASKQPAQNQNVISSLGTTSTASSFDWAGSIPHTDIAQGVYGLQDLLLSAYPGWLRPPRTSRRRAGIGEINDGYRKRLR